MARRGISAAITKAQRVAALSRGAVWIEKQIEGLNVANVAPTVLKTLLTELREYYKQIAQETGEWQERKDAAAVGKSLADNLSRLSEEELASLKQIRAKLDGK